MPHKFKTLDVRPRSEEHTSELQSLRHLVCRLLLEKNKIQKAGTWLSRSCTRPLAGFVCREPARSEAGTARKRRWRRARPESFFSSLFFFNDTATTEIYTLSLHDALPI